MHERTGSILNSIFQVKMSVYGLKKFSQIRWKSNQEDGYDTYFSIEFGNKKINLNCLRSNPSGLFPRVLAHCVCYYYIILHYFVGCTTEWLFDREKNVTDLSSTCRATPTLPPLLKNEVPPPPPTPEAEITFSFWVSRPFLF